MASHHITVNRKRVLEVPIDRGDYVLTRRDILRAHFTDEGFVLYFQEGGGERGEYFVWTERTKAAFEALTVPLPESEPIR